MSSGHRFTAYPDPATTDRALHERATSIAGSVVAVTAPTPERHPSELKALATAYLDLLARRGLPPVLKMEPTIQLASGVYFNYLDPENSPWPVEAISSALGKIARWGGHTKVPYSVAQHMVHTAENVEDGYQFEAAMHDAHEGLVGDCMTPLKQLCPDFQNYEHVVESDMRRRFHLPATMSPQVKLADLRMAATEKRDVMPDDDGVEWEFLHKIVPYEFRITPWSAEEASARWLALFRRLWLAHGIHRFLQGKS